MHTKPNDNPRLRTIDITEFYHQGQPALLLRDPLRLGDNHVVLPRALAPALSLMDGTDDLHELHAELLLRFRMNVPVDVLQQLIEVLDEAFLLDNQRAAEAREHALLAYRAAPFRPPSMAGQSYPAEPRQLAQLLDGYLAAVNGTGPASAAGRGVISPHIDYPRGGPVYAAVWKRAAEMARAADLVILLDADPEILHSRKPELALDERYRQREAYFKLLGGISNCRIIDAAKDQQTVIGEIREAIVEALESGQGFKKL